MDYTYTLQEYYIKYLVDVRHLSKSSVAHYLDAISWISKYLKRKSLLNDNLYEVTDLSSLEALASILLTDDDFVSMNKRGHQMYTAGLNNYLRFAKGENFEKLGKQLMIMDSPIQIPEPVTEQAKTTWKRSEIIKQQVLKAANYTCEINNNHHTFVVAGTLHSYMEGHHSIPMSLQEKFNTSLDVYSNIICVCPVCHRLLHYAGKTEKKPVLEKIYYDRADRLAQSGIRVSHDDFLSMTL